MGQVERGNNTSIASPSPQSSLTITTANQTTTASIMTVLAPKAGDSFPTGAGHKPSATFSAAGSVVARVPGTSTGGDKTEEARNPTTGWAMSWGQLLWEKWRWGAVIALAVLVSRFSSSTWPLGYLFMLDCETPMCQFRSPISRIWFLSFICLFRNPLPSSPMMKRVVQYFSKHLSRTRSFFFNTCYSILSFIPAFIQFPAPRLLVVFCWILWGKACISVCSSGFDPIVNLSQISVVLSVDVQSMPRCFQCPWCLSGPRS